MLRLETRVGVLRIAVTVARSLGGLKWILAPLRPASGDGLRALRPAHAEVAATVRRHRRLRSEVGLLKARKQASVVAGLCWLVLLVGCKNAEDAAAAATQMTATAKALSAYYQGVETMLAKTEEIQALNAALYGKPLLPQTRAREEKTRADLEQRVALAAGVSALAEAFAKLTASKAPAAVGASAANLDAAAEALAGVTASTGVQSAVTIAAQTLATAIQERKEREAARAMDELVRNLAQLFASETPAWNSVDAVYTQLGADLAQTLVDQNGVNTSTLLTSPLEPFGLKPAVPTTDESERLKPLAKQQIATRQASLDAAYAKATTDMGKSLDEMARKVHVVAEDKPIVVRATPLTLASVEQWVAQISPK